MPPRSRAKVLKAGKSDLPKDLNQLEFQLQKFLKSDNQGIAQATAVLKRFINTLSSIPLLVERIAQPGSDPYTRQLAAVLLCKRISRYWQRLNTKSGLQTKIGSRVQLYRDALLGVLEGGDATPQVIQSVSYLVSIIGRIDLSKQRWPGLVDWITNCVINDPFSNVNRLEAGLRVLRSLLLSRASHHLEPLFDSYSQCFVSLIDHESTPPLIRSRAVMALDALFKAFTDETDSQRILSTFDVLIRAIDRSLNHDDIDTVNTILEILTQAVDTDGFDNLIGPIFSQVLRVVEHHELDLKLRTQAAEFILQYVTVKPANFTKPLELYDAQGKQLRLLDISINAVLKLFVEDDEEPFDQSEQTPQKIGVSIVDQFFKYLPRGDVFNLLIPHFFEFIGNASNEYCRKAAFVIVMTITESAPGLLSTFRTTYNGEDMLFLKAFTAVACQTLQQDPSALVRVAICVALTWLGEYMGHLLSELGNLNSPIVQSILNVLETQQCSPDFRNKLLMALDSIIEAMGAEVIPYLGTIMNQIGQQFSHPSLEVRESAISTIQSLAVSSNEGFQPFFKPTLAELQKIVLTPEKEEELTLRSRALVAISAIALGVGMSAWDNSDQVLLSEITKNVLQLSRHEDISVRSSALIYLGNIVSALAPAYETSSDVQQIATETFNFCLRTINSLEGVHFQNADADAPKLAGFDDDDSDDSNDDDDDDQQGIKAPVLGQNLSMDVLSANSNSNNDDEDIVIDDELFDDDEEVYFETEALELKSTALSTLSLLLQSLKENFSRLQCDLSYDGEEQLPSEPLARTVHIVLEATAYLSGQYLLSCFYTLHDILIVLNRLEPVNPQVGIRKQLPDSVRRLMIVIVARLIDVLEEEDDPDVVSTVLDQFNTLFPVYGMSLIYDEAVTRFYDILSAICHESAPCQLDDESREMSSEHGGELLDSICELITTMVQQYGPVLKTEFIDPQGIIECLLNFCHEQRPDSFRALAIGSLAELVELTGPPAVDFIPSILPIGVQALVDHSSMVRHNAIYFIGECAVVAGDQLNMPPEMLQQSYQILLQHILTPEQLAACDVSDLLVLHDNAVSSALKFVLAWPNLFPPAQTFPQLFAHIPLQNDFEEPCKVVLYAQRAFEMDQGAMMPFLPNIIAQIGTVYQRNMVAIRTDLEPQIKQFLHVLLQKFPQECSAIFGQLSPELQQTLSTLTQ